jgi:hypothetical protein
MKGGTLLYLSSDIDPYYDPTAFFASFGVFFGVLLLVDLVILGFTIYLYWKVATKAGYPGAYSLLLLVPIANIVIIIMFAFQEWPIEAELRALRQQQAFAGGGLPAPGYGPPSGYGAPSGYGPGPVSPQVPPAPGPIPGQDPM